MLKKIKKLNRTSLREIHGGVEKCDIGPIGCPCKIAPGDPCLGGPGGNPEGPTYGYCPDNPSYILCTETCPNGTSPLCPLS